MEERTEEDKVTRAPLKVILGDEEYEITPLVMRDSKAWRAKAAPFRASAVSLAATNSDDTVAFEAAFQSTMLERLDQAIELFFEYAKALDRDEIMGKANDNELVKAWSKVVEFAFPLGL